MVRQIFHIGCLALFCAVSVLFPLAANVMGTEPSAFNLKSAQKNIESTSKSFEVKDIAELQLLREQIALIKKQADQCIEEQVRELNKISRALTVPESQRIENSGGNLRDNSLQTRKNEAEERLASCRYLSASAEELLSRLIEKENIFKKKDLFYHSPRFLPHFFQQKDSDNSFENKFQNAWQTINDHFAKRTTYLLPLIIGALIIVFWLRRSLISYVDHETTAHVLAIGFRHHATFWQYCIIPCIALAFSAHLSMDKGKFLLTPNLPFIILSIIAATLLTIEITLFRTKNTHLYLQYKHHINAIAGVSILYYFFSSILWQKNLSLDLEYAATLVLLSILSLLIILFSIRTCRDKTGPLICRWSKIAAFIFIISLCSGFLGYFNLMVYLSKGVIGSILGLLFLNAGKYLIKEIIGGLAYGTFNWHRKIRIFLKIKDSDTIVGLVWLSLLANVFLWICYFFALVWLWSVSDTQAIAILSIFKKGVSIGDLTILPGKIFWGLVVFGIFWSAISWLTSKVKKELRESRLSKSAQDTTASLVSYSGFGLAVAIGLGIAGMDFSNLAIIFGALSVGIGFGLQNIVNNFVSGLILLFERPIVRGDWIIVGSTEGYVSKISVRSTIIRTFDRADVIVPNSELISGQVTNWMKTDRIGRVKVPVGVAYGSDTGKVKKILLEAALNHPNVITSDSKTIPAPHVLFLEFGDSSLNFELRFFIKDIDERLITRSDINFAIDAAFRENGIQIPFPQRDVHIINSS